MLISDSRSVRPFVHLSVDRMVSDHYLKKYLSQGFRISHADWSLWGQDPYWFWVNLVKGQSYKGHFCKIKKNWLPLIILRTVYHRAFIFHMFIGLGKDMTSIDFGFTWSKVRITTVLFENDLRSFFLFITEVLFTCRLVLVRAFLVKLV